MSSALITLLLLLAIVWLWLDGARARELATAIARAACERRGWQLLDGTVSLRRMAIRQTQDGLRFRRMFSFEYSRNTVDRLIGHVLLLGIRLENLEIYREPEPQPIEPAAPAEVTVGSIADAPQPPQQASNVVPFRRR